jgi:hypothetical protein
MTDAGHDAADARARRQAPRYGEYASPEEVAALRGPDAAPPAPPAPLAPPTTRPLPGPPPAGLSRAAGWDRIFTIGLLAYGAWNVVSSIIAFLDMRTVVAESARMLVAGDVHMPGWVQGVAYGVIALYAALFAAAVIWSRHRLRHGRIAFWVPLGVGVVGLIAGVAFLSVALSASGVDLSVSG